MDPLNQRSADGSWMSMDEREAGMLFCINLCESRVSKDYIANRTRSQRCTERTCIIRSVYVGDVIAGFPLR